MTRCYVCGAPEQDDACRFCRTVLKPAFVAPPRVSGAVGAVSGFGHSFVQVRSGYDDPRSGLPMKRECR